MAEPAGHPDEGPSGGKLGLTHNPFSHPGDGFFEGAGRQGALEQLRHLSRWSRRLLVVSGSRGIGKTTLYRALSANLDPRAKAARINGTLVSSGRDVMVSIAQGFGIAVPTNASDQLLFELVASGVMDAGASDRVCMVLIDDAQLLDSRAIDQILNVIAQQDLRVVCFAEKSFLGALQRSAKRLADDVPWHELALPTFDSDAVRRYVEWRCKEAGYRGHSPFSDEQLDKISQMSAGLPDRVNAVASEALIELGIGPKKHRSTFPVVHRAIAMLLIVVVAALYVVWPASDDMDMPSDSVAMATGAPGALMDSDIDDLDLEEPVEIPDEEPEIQVSIERERVIARPRVDVASEPAQNTQAPVERPVAQPDQLPVVAADTQVTESEQPAQESAVESTVREVAQREVAATPEPVPTLVAEPEPSVVDTRPAPVSAIPVVTASSGDPWRDGNWVLAQEDSRYTIQLLGSGDAQRVREYIQSQRDPSEFASYPTVSNGRSLYIVVYGLFSDKAAADAAATRLPAETGKVSPWVRSIGSIKQAVRSGR